MKYRELTPESYKDFKPYFENQTYNHSSYSLASIIAWENDDYKPYGIINKNKAIIFADFIINRKNRHLLLPLSPEKPPAPQELLNIARIYDFDQYWFVPDQYINSFERAEIENYFSIEEQPGYHDYIYCTNDLIELKGNKYRRKRNHIAQFNKIYKAKETVTIESIHPGNTHECKIFLEEWCKAKKCDADENIDLTCEKNAITNALEHIETLELRGILLRIAEKVCAFGIGAKLTNNMGVLHFQKASTDIKGLYQFFDRECSQRLFGEFAYINKEGDMEIQGLARSKRSYSPIKLIKSYKLKIQI